MYMQYICIYVWSYYSCHVRSLSLCAVWISIVLLPSRLLCNRPERAAHSPPSQQSSVCVVHALWALELRLLWAFVASLRCRVLVVLTTALLSHRHSTATVTAAFWFTCLFQLLLFASVVVWRDANEQLLLVEVSLIVRQDFSFLQPSVSCPAAFTTYRIWKVVQVIGSSYYYSLLLQTEQHDTDRTTRCRQNNMMQAEQHDADRTETRAQVMGTVEELQHGRECRQMQCGQNMQSSFVTKQVDLLRKRGILC